MNVILEGKVPFELRLYFIGAKLIALKKPGGGLRPIAVGNTFRQLSAKIAGYHVFESRQARYGNRQIGVGTKRCAELASRVFRCLIESLQPKENGILKIDFENALKPINRHFMLEKNFGIYPEVYKYSHSAYSQSSILLYGDSLIKSCEGTQQGDPESPALFSDSIQDLIDSLQTNWKRNIKNWKKLIELLKNQMLTMVLMLKNCFNLPKMLYFLRTSICFDHPALLEKYDKTVRDRVSKVCNVNSEDSSRKQLALPAEMGGLGV